MTGAGSAATRPAAVTIGKFDGVHAGHRAIVAETVRAARRAHGAAVALTLWPHPLAVLRPGTPLTLIDPLEDRLDILASLGLDQVFKLDFDLDFAAQRAEDFLGDIKRRFEMTVLVVGLDARLGRDRHAGVKELESITAALGVELITVGPVSFDGDAVGSGRIRGALTRGDVETATRMLARFPSYAGEVGRGSERGRQLGFPTVNLPVSPDRCLPRSGVYAGAALVPAEQGLLLNRAVINLGTRPTFGGGAVALEAHLLDFSADLYGKTVRIYFERRLRDERKFTSAHDLAAAIREDVQAAAATPPGDPDLYLPWYGGPSV